MSRDIAAGTLTKIQADQVRLVTFVEMDFPSEFLRVNNSSYNIDWNGYTWLGVGMLGTIQPFTEGSDMSAQPLTFTISGVPSTNVAKALLESYQGRSCKLWIAALDENYQIADDPVGSFNYRMDTMQIEMGEMATISVTAESRLVDWERANNSRYTNEEQQRLYPDDYGLEFVAELVEKNIILGYV